MSMLNLAVFHTVEVAGFYLPSLTIWVALAAVPSVLLQRGLERFGLYRFVWHRSLFNLALYVLLVGGVVLLGNLAWL
jgi:hypothetical protein